jgi:hypothetical protein
MNVQPEKREAHMCLCTNMACEIIFSQLCYFFIYGKTEFKLHAKNISKKYVKYCRVCKFKASSISNNEILSVDENSS